MTFSNSIFSAKILDLTQNGFLQLNVSSDVTNRLNKQC